MAFSSVVSSAARSDVLEAQRWYKSRALVHAVRFRVEFFDLLRDTREAPLRWSVWRPPDYRRRLFTDFPYVIVYHVDGRVVVIDAVLHQSQDADLRFPRDP